LSSSKAIVIKNKGFHNETDIGLYVSRPH